MFNSVPPVCTFMKAPEGGKAPGSKKYGEELLSGRFTEYGARIFYVGFEDSAPRCQDSHSAGYLGSSATKTGIRDVLQDPQSLLIILRNSVSEPTHGNSSMVAGKN
ncbi:hypothetical protein FQN53_008413 [Emmonsiellopsis sp. PD_33]|nr:hypothetical protein FQN53_008413 [Emmonsiellopsis sp. PD_33]